MSFLRIGTLLVLKYGVHKCCSPFIKFDMFDIMTPKNSPFIHDIFYIYLNRCILDTAEFTTNAHYIQVRTVLTPVFESHL